MNRLLDKLIVFIFCSVLFLQNVRGAYMVVPVVIALTAGSLNSYFESDRPRVFCFAAYLIVCFIFPSFLFFVPLISYDILLTGWQWCLLAALAAVGVHFSAFSPLVWLLLFLLTALTWLMKRRTDTFRKMTDEYAGLRDSAKEFSLRLEDKNKELMEKQDYEINLATLNERNRIAREIHDSVGHLLSSAILQIGALMAVCKDEAARESLHALKDTLSKGMDSIRDSIHDLYEESVDLYVEVNKLAKDFSFCPLSLDYDIQDNPEKKYKYAFLSILKEALANIIKHSDATFVSVSLREHPALYQLIVKDNGTKRNGREASGLGLKNIADRVEGLGGVVNFTDEGGFTVFVSIPKE